MGAKGIPLVGALASRPAAGALAVNDIFIQIDTAGSGSGVYQTDGAAWAKTFELTDIPMSTNLATVGSNPPGGFYDAVASGAVGNGTTDDTAIIQQMIDWACAIQGGVIWLTPGRTFKVTGLILRQNVQIRGEMRSSVLYSTTNAPIIDCNVAEYAAIDGVTIRGSVSAGSSQIGLKMDGAADFAGMTVHNVLIESCGGHGLYLGARPFSPNIYNVHVDNCADYPILIDAPTSPNLTLRNCYVHTLRSGAVVAYRIKRGYVTLDNCNGVDNSPAIAGSKWCVAGKKSGVDGDVANASATVRLVDCNIESLATNGVLSYYGSQIDIDGRTKFTGLSSGVKPIEFDLKEGTNGDGNDFFVQQIICGRIMDSVAFTDAAGTFANSQAIHANGFAPLQTMGQGPSADASGNPKWSTFYNSVTSTVQKLRRADGNLSKLAVTGTVSITQPGVRYIELNLSAAASITIPWSGWYSNAQEVLVIVDIAGNLATNNATIIPGASGTIGGQSNFVMNRNRQCLILVPDGDTAGGAWRVIGNYAASDGTKRVTTQFNKTSDTTLANVTGLSVDVAAGKTYKFKATIFTTSPTSGGIKMALGGTATATAVIFDAFYRQGGTEYGTGTSRYTSLGTFITEPNAAAVTVFVEGAITVNADGTFVVQFAQNTSNGTASSVLVGSTFHVQQVD